MTNGNKPGIGSCYSPERAEHAKRRHPALHHGGGFSSKRLSDRVVKGPDKSGSDVENKASQIASSSSSPVRMRTTRATS